MKKLLAFLLVSLIFGVSAGLISWAEKSLTAPKNTPLSFTFKSPIPPEILSQNQIPINHEIERVFLSGTFNNWKDQDEAYKMSQTGDGTWSLKINMAPGQLQYKYVVYFKGRNVPVWTHDVNLGSRVEDGFGGHNSFLSGNDSSWWYSPLYYILLGSSLLSLLMGLMEAVSFVVFRYGLSERLRSLVLIWLASVFALGFALLMNMDSQRTLARSSVVDSLNLFHLFLSGEGFDPQTAGDPRLLAGQFQKGKTWFYKADARNNSRIFNNQQTTLRSLFLFDKEFRLLSHLERQAENGRTAYWVRKTGTRSAPLYYQNYLFKDLITDAKTRAVPSAGLFGKENEPMLSGLPLESRQAVWLLGFDAVLLPIYQNQEIQGYYGALIHPEVFSEGLYQLLLMNLFWLLAITATAFLYYFILPKPKDENEEKFQRFAARYALSSREKEVLAHLIRGLSNQDIGVKLFISEGTVKVHVHKIYQKSGVSSRMELLDHLSHI